MADDWRCLDPSKYRWVPAAASPSCATPAVPGQTLVVFDFDCTLTAVHLFEALRSRDGKRELMRDPAAFYQRIFGGAQRIAALQRFLGALSAAGHTLRVLSFGFEGEIDAALRHIEVDSVFSGVYGNAAQSNSGLTARPAEYKQQMITTFQRELGARTIFFADDDFANFPANEACSSNPANGQRARGRRGPAKLAHARLGRYELQAVDAEIDSVGTAHQHIFPVGFGGVDPGRHWQRP